MRLPTSSALLGGIGEGLTASRIERTSMAEQFFDLGKHILSCNELGSRVFDGSQAPLDFGFPGSVNLIG